MGGTQQHDSQIHPKVEHLEDLRLGEVQHDDSTELRQRDTGENRTAHFGQSVRRPFESGGFHRHRETVHQVRAEFHADAHGHHQIDQRHGVQGDVPPVHQTAKIHQDHCDGDQHDHAGKYVQAHQEERRQENGQQ